MYCTVESTAAVCTQVLSDTGQSKSAREDVPSQPARMSPPGPIGEQLPLRLTNRSAASICSNFVRGGRGWAKIKAKFQNIAKIIEIGTFLKNRDPPLCFQNSQIEIGTFLVFFTPPPLLGHVPNFLAFLF